MKNILALFIFLMVGSSIPAQIILKGKVVDEESGKPLSLVQISVQPGSSGSITDSSGTFVVNTSVKKGVIQFQTMGYQPLKRKFHIKNGKDFFIGEIDMKRSPYVLEEVKINAGIADKNRSPITLAEIESRAIKTKLGDRPLPMIFNTIPGVYSSRVGGGTGDARLTIRGFKQENVAILINGIPVNGEENGLVYWSNWQGLADAAASIQIQKGPGVTNMASNAVGGSINIITSQPHETKSGLISAGITAYGNYKILTALNTGKMKNGWSLSFLGHHESGPGWVDATYVNSWAYYLNATKTINKHHKVNITFLGSPQKHGQRTLKLTKKEVDLHGYLFNKDWGGYNGRIKNASENFYHKPFLSVNHYWNIDKNKSLVTNYYISYGNGGGLWSESFQYAPSIFSYRNPSGQIDWPLIYENNASHQDEYILENGDTVQGFSKNVQTKFLASHIVTGLITTYQQHINDTWTFKSGVNYKYFNSYLREEIEDLLGGNFFIEDYAWAVEGCGGRDQIKGRGDIIRVDNNSIINFLGAYAQLLFRQKKLNGYFSLNGNSHFYKRIDRFNYLHNTHSELVTKPGLDLRTGIAYLPSKEHKIYLNGSYFNKAPYFKFVFGNFNNTPVHQLKNEKVLTAETGYVYNNDFLRFSTAVYVTSWNNVSMLSNEYIQLEDNQQTRAMVNGLNALHYGFESELIYRFNNGWKLTAFASVGDYRWKNDVHATLFNDNNIPVDTVNVYAKNLRVGGTAQQQAGASFYFDLFKVINIQAEWIYYGKIFADFDPVNRNLSEDRTQPYEFPSYHMVNLYLNTPFRIGKKTASLDLGFYNLLNNHFIEMGEDGPDHTIQSFKGFWNPGFTFQTKLNFYF